MGTSPSWQMETRLPATGEAQPRLTISWAVRPTGSSFTLPSMVQATARCVYHTAPPTPSRAAAATAPMPTLSRERREMPSEPWCVRLAAWWADALTGVTPEALLGRLLEV